MFFQSLLTKKKNKSKTQWDIRLCCLILAEKNPSILVRTETKESIGIYSKWTLHVVRIH